MKPLPNRIFFFMNLPTWRGCVHEIFSKKTLTRYHQVYLWHDDDASNLLHPRIVRRGHAVQVPRNLCSQVRHGDELTLKTALHRAPIGQNTRQRKKQQKPNRGG